MDDQPHVEIRLGDCREIIATLPDCSIDSIVTDPPYELGFMGKKWDATGIAYDMNLWAECLRVIKPGGHLLAFGGTRTYHRMTCAIEDAGFEIRDCIGWLYSSGFPKSHNLKGEWDGWGTALKPALEPVVMARKPLIGTVAANVTEHGTGALNIDSARILSDDGYEKQRDRPISTNISAPSGKYISEGIQHTVDLSANKPTLGRWPANVIVDETVANTVEWSRYFYCPKASRTERNAGINTLEWQHTDFGGNGKPGAGFNEVTHGKAPTPAANNHPTVKPLELMRYLVRLVTPPGGTVLEPFAGSGTTLAAAIIEGFNVIGCELTADYLPIIEGRIAWAYEQYAAAQPTLFGETNG
jgi:site-specific DNA-methyltransferase (adenine-specific)